MNRMYDRLFNSGLNIAAMIGEREPLNNERGGCVAYARFPRAKLAWGRSRPNGVARGAIAIG